MKFDYGDFVYGTYNNRDEANRVAETIKEERGCEIDVEVLTI